MDGRFVLSQKGTNLLEDQNGYRYRIHHIISEDNAHYKCIKKNALKCQSFAVFHEETNKIVLIVGRHCHLVDVLKREYQEIENTYVEAAVRVGASGAKRTIQELKMKLFCVPLSFELKLFFVNISTKMK